MALDVDLQQADWLENAPNPPAPPAAPGPPAPPGPQPGAGPIAPQDGRGVPSLAEAIGFESRAGGHANFDVPRAARFVRENMTAAGVHELHQPDVAEGIGAALASGAPTVVLPSARVGLTPGPDPDVTPPMPTMEAALLDALRVGQLLKLSRRWGVGCSSSRFRSTRRRFRPSSSSSATGSARS